MLLFILFFALPLLETWLLIQFSGAYGFGNTIILVLVTAVAGSSLAKKQGLEVFKALQNEVSQGRTPENTLIEGFLILLSALILLLPGLISDALGILLLISPIRKRIARVLPQHIKNTKSSSFQFKSFFQFGDSEFQQHNQTKLKETQEAEYQVIDED